LAAVVPPCSGCCTYLSDTVTSGPGELRPAILIRYYPEAPAFYADGMDTVEACGRTEPGGSELLPSKRLRLGVVQDVE